MTGINPPVKSKGRPVLTPHSEPALDALRALAVLGVLTTHVGFQTGLTLHSAWGPLVARLDAGVAIFFVLSGYLLGRPFVVRKQPLPPYAWRRFLRIVPPYVVVVVVALWMLPENGDATPADWARHLTFTQIATPNHLVHGLTQTWSLCTEVAFYVLLPLLVVPLRRAVVTGRSGLALAICLALVVTNVLWLIGVGRYHWVDSRVAGYWLPSFLSWFAVGLALAVVVSGDDRVSRATRDLLARCCSAPLALWGGALSLLVIASTPVAGPIAFEGSPTVPEAVTKNLLYAAVAALLVTPVVFADPSSRFMLSLASPVPRYLGEISYAVFLWHLIVLATIFPVTGITPFTGQFAHVWWLTVVGSVSVASVSLFVLERPVQGLRHLVPRAPATAAPNAASTSS